jgi:hypothetical protein
LTKENGEEDMSDFDDAFEEAKKEERTPRIIYDMQAEKYHSDPDGVIRLSNSIAGKLLDDSPQHAWLDHPMLGRRNSEPRERVKSLDTGTVIHQMLLGGDTGIEILKTSYPDDDKNEDRRGQVVSDYKTKAAQKERDEILSRGSIPLLQKEMAPIERSCRAIRERLNEIGVQLTGKSEATVLWDSRGTPCKGRLDHIIFGDNEIVIPDLKSCASANPRDLQRKIVDFNYHMQAAAYIEACESIFPEMSGRVRFIDIFVETAWPHFTVPVEIAGSMLELGQRKWRRGVSAWKHCLKNDNWPGYANGIIQIEPSTWAITAEETALASGFEE